MSYNPNNPNGQATSANSAPVVIASDQSSFPVGVPGFTSNVSLTGSTSATVSTVGMSAVLLNISGTWTGTLGFQMSVDGTNFFFVSAVDLIGLGNQAPTTATANGTWAFNVAGATIFRLFNSGTITGTAVVQLGSSPSPSVSTGSLATTFVAQSGTWNVGATTTMPDSYVTGAAAQTATVNNILTTSSGTVATDLSGYHTGAVQVTSTGTGGTFIFEGSNDNVNFQTIPVYNQVVITGTPIIIAIGATASQLIYTFPVNVRYVRLRIATTITGGSIQAFSRFSQEAWTPAVFQVTQTTAANLATTATVASGTVTTVSTVTTLANGQTAHSAASTGSPVRVAGRVNTAVDTTLVAGDVSDLFMTNGGAAIIKPFSVPNTDWQATSALTPLATTSSTALKAAGAAGVKNYCTALQLTNTSAVVSTNVAILDGAAVIWAGFLPATTTTDQQVIVTIEFPTPLQGTAATAMNIQLGTVSASVYYNAQGYQAP